MRSTHPEDQRGPRPAWNGIGFGLVALAVTMYVVFSPVERQPADEPSPPTISIEDLRAMLADAPGDTPATVEVDTPDGPVTVVVPPDATTTTTTHAPRSTTTTQATTTTRPTPTTTTSTVPRTPRDPDDVMAEFLADLELVPTTLPEVPAGE